MQELFSSLAVVLSLASVAVRDVAAAPSSPSPGESESFSSDFDITTNWANLSPYKDAKSFGLPKGVPQGCELSQVHILHRHAQRFPTPYPLDGIAMEEFRWKVGNYSKKHPDVKVGRGPLAFLNEWEDMLGEDTLLPSGAATEAASGASNWHQYGRALYRAGPGVAAWNESLNVHPNGTARPKPTFRTTSQERILESARWWLGGFFSSTDGNNSHDQYDLVVIPEVDPFNNTLASYDSCPGDMTEGDESAKDFVPKYTRKAVSRLSRSFPEDFNLTAFDVLAMQSYCPYEYATMGSSPFCSLFTEQEWRDFEYQVDIQFYGDYGFGSPTGRAQGIGWVLELAARLEGKLIHSSDTSINYTYTNNLEQFPLHQPMYMDMSHDDIIVSVLTALDLDYFKYGPHGLPGNLPHAPNRTFNLNEVTPFGARLATEVWTCPSNVSFEKLDSVLYNNPDLSDESGTTDYLRFVLNTAPVPLDGLRGCEKAENGFCPVKNLLKEIPQLKEKADYQYACFGEYKSGGQVGDGRPEKKHHY